jgi:thiol peroxidase
VDIMAEGRTGEVTFKGGPVTLAGPRLKPGDAAPGFACVTDGLAAVTLADTAGKVRLFSVVPSLDTPVCSIQTKRFADELNALGDKVAAYTVSLDLPFAMKRFCAAEGIANLTNLSDCHDHSFGQHYGVLITSLPIPLLARAIFVVDAAGKLAHVEYVPEIATEPDYGAALAAVKAAAGA